MKDEVGTHETIDDSHPGIQLVRQSLENRRHTPGMVRPRIEEGLVSEEGPKHPANGRMKVESLHGCPTKNEQSY